MTQTELRPCNDPHRDANPRSALNDVAPTLQTNNIKTSYFFKNNIQLEEHRNLYADWKEPG